MTIIDWLNQNNGFTMTLLTTAYVVATVWIVTESRRTNRLQRSMLEQSAALEQSRRRPYVIFSIDFQRVQRRRHDSTVHVYVSIRNVGATSAHDVIVKTTPELKGRMGVEGEMRSPALLNSTVSYMPPNHSLKDFVTNADFFFKDNTDAALKFSVAVSYKDATGTPFAEQYLIDAAAQKEMMEVVDESDSSLPRMAEHLERLSKSVEEMMRVANSADRSRFMTPIGSQARITSEQLALLIALRAASGEEEFMTFFASLSIADTKARIRPMRDAKSVASEDKNLTAHMEDLEYLCRLGALHGHYSRGMLQFAVTPVAEQLIENRQGTQKPWKREKARRERLSRER